MLKKRRIKAHHILYVSFSGLIYDYVMHGHAESELTKRIDEAVIKAPLFTKAAPLN